MKREFEDDISFYDAANEQAP